MKNRVFPAVLLIAAHFALAPACSAPQPRPRDPPEIPPETSDKNPDSALTSIAEQLSLRLHTPAIAAQVIPFRIVVEGPVSGRLFVDPQARTVSLGDGPADGTMTLDSVTLGRIVAGDLAFQDAFAQGNVTVNGDMTTMMQAALFLDPKARSQQAAYESRRAPVAAARQQLFDSWGLSWPDGRTMRMLPHVSAALSWPEAAWPFREEWFIATSPNTTVIGTDGLSDPFDDPSRPEHGFGFEVYAETDEQLKDPKKSWLMALVMEVSYQVAAGAIKKENLEYAGVFSFEIEPGRLEFDGKWPASLITPNGTIGMLIGATNNSRTERLPAPFDDIRYYCIRILKPTELATLLREGRPAYDRMRNEGHLSRLR